MSQSGIDAFDRLTLPDISNFLTVARSVLSTGAATLDLQHIRQVDSSALAALLAIARAAPQGCSFRNPPESLTNLARLYGVDQLLFPDP